MNAARKREAAAPMADDPYLSIPQTAKAIGVAEATVKSLALQGKLKHRMAAGRVVIERASVDAYNAMKAQQR